MSAKREDRFLGEVVNLTRSSLVETVVEDMSLREQAVLCASLSRLITLLKARRSEVHAELRRHVESAPQDEGGVRRLQEDDVELSLKPSGAKRPRARELIELLRDKGLPPNAVCKEVTTYEVDEAKLSKALDEGAIDTDDVARASFEGWVLWVEPPVDYEQRLHRHTTVSPGLRKYLK